MRIRPFLIFFFVLLSTWIAAQPVSIDPPSAVIEPGGSVTLTASGALYYVWSPATGLSTTDGPVTVATPAVTTTYTCSGYGPGPESVVNGDFEQGNIGFTSAYNLSFNLWDEGTYYVDSVTSPHHENFFGTGHGDSGNFMIVNGATTPRTNVWTQQINVNPHAYYAFSTWVCTLAGQANEVALLQFSINGNQIGEVFSAPPERYVWEQFYELWYSEEYTTATITILNQNTVGSGNDFGLDDISFCELLLLGAPQCTVTVENMTAVATSDDTELCEGASTTLHALPTGGVGNYTYSWSPSGTLDDASSQHPMATPEVGNTTYTCQISDGYSTQEVSVMLVVHPNVEHDIYKTICDNDVYSFHGEEVHIPGVYDYTLSTDYGCDSIIHLHLDNWQTYETGRTEHFCKNDSYDFYGERLDEPGVYYHTLQSLNECDSVIRLTLIQDPVYEFEMWESTCEGGPGYYFDGQYLQPRQEPYIFSYNTVKQCDSVIVLHVDEDEYNSKNYNVSLCGSEFIWGSNGVTYYETGIYYDTLQFDDVCDSTLVLNLELRPNYNDDVFVMSCDDYHWKNDDFDVDMTFTESVDYTHQYINAFGCESEATLHLTINDHDEYEFTVPEEENCDNYYWNPKGLPYTTDDMFDPGDHVYTQSGIYHRTYQNTQGCDSLVTMKVQFDYTPTPTPIYPMDTANMTPHWVVTATEFQINDYDFHLWDNNPLCHWDTVMWSLEGSAEWVIEPFGDKGKCCKVYVLNHVNDTMWLKAHAFNRCAQEDGVEQKYWLVCSFYGIKEPSEAMADFTVFPNPNNGVMNLYFNRLSGKINVKIYSMMGELIDDVQYQTEMTGNTFQYDMRSCPSGVYFFVATGKEGTVAKKVIVNR